MNMKRQLAAFGLLLSANSAYGILGPIEIYLNAENIQSSHFNNLETKATFPSEIYTAEDIKNSMANNLYDFLGQNTSISIMPGYGNLYSQKIDMRGFGITDGYENIIITLDGRKLNNIDLVPQYLASTGLDNIEKIEVTKGSGSVVYGDGATAGAIHIYTKQKVSHSISVTAGNFNLQKIAVNSGFKTDKLKVLVSLGEDKLGGYSTQDLTGNKTKSNNGNYQVDAIYSFSDNTKLSIAKSNSNVNTRYPNPLTLAQFNADPSQAPNADKYTQQKYLVDGYDFALGHKINNHLNVNFRYSIENKDSNYFSGSSSYTNESKYKNDQKGITIDYKKGAFSGLLGVNIFENYRKQSDDKTSKDNSAYFVKGIYNLGVNNISIGLRKEEVLYLYEPKVGSILKDSKQLNAFDIGLNHQYSKNLSMFINYNESFLAPNIDRFFKYGGGFNAFIKPAKVKTINIGSSYLQPKSKTKITFFYADLNNEIYYNGASFKNTNLDKSHKYGIDIQYNRKINKHLRIKTNYVYTIAKIDEEDEGNGVFNGKYLPGVSKHGFNVGLNYKLNDKSQISVKHKYRSESFSADDFENNLTQKQQAFETTSVLYFYRFSKQLNFAAGIENLFEKRNGLWIKDDNIYPVNFTRNIKFTVDYKF